MARNVADLTFASKVMLNAACRIPPGTDGQMLLCQPWREAKLPEKLRLGYFIEFGGVKVSAVCQALTDGRQVQLVPAECSRQWRPYEKKDMK